MHAHAHAAHATSVKLCCSLKSEFKCWLLQMLEEEQGPQSVKASRVRRLTAMGFKEKAARIALKAAGNSIEGALEQLQVRLMQSS